MSKIRQLNQMLGKHGLALLSDPRALMQQLALGIKDHERFRKMLVTVEPEKRQVAYDTMRSFLSFEAKPLDVYLAEAGQQAEREQLPTVDPKAPEGYKPFEPARNAEEACEACELNTPGNREFKHTCHKYEDAYKDAVLMEQAEKAIHDGMAFEKSHKRLTLVCNKCTRQAEFFGETLVDAVQAGRKAGWVYDAVKDCEICPKCPARRSN